MIDSQSEMGSVKCLFIQLQKHVCYHEYEKISDSIFRYYDDNDSYGWSEGQTNGSKENPNFEEKSS